ncbi:MAG TPA: response regulator [Chthoniobacterales bacterium]|nr:response regulator [Chthoniobacterales bacterium]
MPASHETPAGTASSVLLVEEYDALAAAITSALKKFAPRHRTRAVESLAEAETVAAEITPQLFIVDFDPPRPDAIEFLERISLTNPDARFLAIASGVPVEFSADRFGPNAIQFVEKPFELAEFGAAVQALLGPWTNAVSGDSRGTLRDLNVKDLIPLQCLNMASAVLHLRSADDRTGEIHFLDGQITHVVTGNFTGSGALLQMMRWKNPRARETERVVDAPRTIHGAWPQVFLEALRQTKALPPEPAAAPTPTSAPAAIEQPKLPVQIGKKIVVIDDTEMLLIFVEDALATADPSLQIVTAFTGSEGVRRAEVMIPDLVLLDYSLPDLRGDQVCERLLQNEATARIPVVMMSGHVPEMMDTAQKYRNVVATIAKPFMSDALVTVVRQILAKGPLPAAPLPSPPAPARQGNGKKPAKKNGASTTAEVAEKPRTPTPAPATPPPLPTPAVPVSPTPISSEAVPPIAPPKPAVAPAPREVRPAEPALHGSHPVAAPATPPASLAASNGSAVVLGLGMEVIAIQFTPRFQIGSIRAKPTASTLSLTHPSSSAPAENLLAGFEIGPVELDAQGRIRLMRVVPTRRPANSIHTRNGFEINDVTLVNQNASIELTAGQAAPMTMQLVAMFKVAGVELSDRFEVAQLVLQPAGNRVRITLDPQSPSPGGTEFETVQVRLDSSARIAEFVLNSAAA